MSAELMSFAKAARLQYRYGSYYTVWLISPDGFREYLGFTACKSGSGLLALLQRDSVQARVKRFPDAGELTLRKTAGALILSNGWRIAFGRTIRQEASETPTEEFPRGNL